MPTIWEIILLVLISLLFISFLAFAIIIWQKLQNYKPPLPIYQPCDNPAENNTPLYILQNFVTTEEAKGNPTVLLSDVILPCGRNLVRIDYVLIGRFGCCCIDVQNININTLSDTCGCINGNLGNPGFTGNNNLQRLIACCTEKACLCSKALTAGGQCNVPCTPCVINTNENVPVNLTPCQPVCNTNDLDNLLNLGFFHSDNGTKVGKCARLLRGCRN